MSCRATRATRLSITARASAAEKTRFATLAHVAGISESRLALMAIRAFVDEDGRTQGQMPESPSTQVSTRICRRFGHLWMKTAGRRDPLHTTRPRNAYGRLTVLPFACARAMELSSLVAL